jgi:hypothetical protein
LDVLLTKQRIDQLDKGPPTQCERIRDRVEGVREMRRLGGDDYSVTGWVDGPGAEAADLRQGTSLHIRKSLIFFQKSDLGVNISLI